LDGTIAELPGLDWSAAEPAPVPPYAAIARDLKRSRATQEGFLLDTNMRENCHFKQEWPKLHIGGGHSLRGKTSPEAPVAAREHGIFVHS
jgi:hypothetical protein